MYTATYSPDDNKLRLYASSRLDPDTYARVKAHGFIWAPKQELFVAPMWTPDREDLLLELAGEIGDDDRNLVDRAEERAERFEEYHESRTEDYHAAHAAVKAISDHIPFGQPILVGHHSEKHARKDAERIDNGMRRAVKMWETAQYWKSRAAGAIRHAKYKELPAVRSRRIKTIQAEKRKHERTVARSRKFLEAWRSGSADNVDRAIAVANYDSGYFSASHTHPSGYVGPISLWAALKDGVATVPEVRDKAIANHESLIAHAERWIAHYLNRLEYESAMLGESGGTVVQKAGGPEQGGAIRSWVRRSAWLTIQKVNKVSVTVLDNWGNGGTNFKRTVKLDDVKAIMSRAEVQAAYAEGRAVDLEDRTGFLLTGAPSDPGAWKDAVPAAPVAQPEDLVCPDGPTCPDESCREPCPGGLNVSPFADLPESPKRDQALERWAKA